MVPGKEGGVGVAAERRRECSQHERHPIMREQRRRSKPSSSSSCARERVGFVAFMQMLRKWEPMNGGGGGGFERAVCYLAGLWRHPLLQ